MEADSNYKNSKNSLAKHKEVSQDPAPRTYTYPARLTRQEFGGEVHLGDQSLNYHNCIKFSYIFLVGL